MPYPVADTITFLFQVFPLLLSHIRNWFDTSFPSLPGTAKQQEPV
jgi:hypothetical protein